MPCCHVHVHVNATAPTLHLVHTPFAVTSLRSNGRSQRAGSHLHPHPVGPEPRVCLVHHLRAKERTNTHDMTSTFSQCSAFPLLCSTSLDSSPTTPLRHCAMPAGAVVVHFPSGLTHTTPIAVLAHRLRPGIATRCPIVHLSHLAAPADLIMPWRPVDCMDPLEQGVAHVHLAGGRLHPHRLEMAYRVQEVVHAEP